MNSEQRGGEDEVEGRTKQRVLSGSWALTVSVRQFLGAVLSGLHSCVAETGTPEGLEGCRTTESIL